MTEEKYTIDLDKDYCDSLDDRLEYLESVLALLTIDYVSEIEGDHYTAGTRLRESCIRLAGHLAGEARWLYGKDLEKSREAMLEAKNG